MERRIKEKINEYISKFKNDLNNYIDTKDLDDANKNYIINYVNNYTVLELTKDDFVRRKRVKNVVPYYERCKAKRANGERCTRRKKSDEDFCGTHVKGQPHGIASEDAEPAKYKKVTVKAEDIRGIIYYLDSNNNVYDPQDIRNGIKNPRIIAKYQYNNGVYSIPEFGI